MDWSKSLLILFFVSCNISQGTPALSKAAVQQTKRMMKSLCLRNSPVSPDTLSKFKEGEFLDDRNLKCYVHCCLGMMKTMRKDKITVDEATKQIETLLPEELREPSLKQLNACKDTEGVDACDKAFNFVKCCYGVDPNNMLIPT